MWDRQSSAASLPTKPSYLPLLDPRRLLRLRRRARGRRRELRLPGITLAGSEDLPRDLQDLRPGAASQNAAADYVPQMWPKRAGVNSVCSTAAIRSVLRTRSGVSPEQDVDCATAGGQSA